MACSPNRLVAVLACLVTARREQVSYADQLAHLLVIHLDTLANNVVVVACVPHFKLCGLGTTPCYLGFEGGGSNTKCLHLLFAFFSIAHPNEQYYPVGVHNVYGLNQQAVKVYTAACSYSAE